MSGSFKQYGLKMSFFGLATCRISSLDSSRRTKSTDPPVVQIKFSRRIKTESYLVVFNLSSPKNSQDRS